MKRRSNKSAKSGRGVGLRAQLSDGPSYRGQQKVILRLEGQAVKLSTTVTTGLISNSLALSQSNIQAFAARFSTTFDEYRILGADVRITPISASSGVSKMWFDEKVATAPSANEPNQRTSVPFANTNAQSQSQKIMRWRARDLLDLEYTTITTVSTPVYFKTYTDAATWGAPVVATDLWLIEPIYIVEFRGLKST